jgi:hypothetical protein
MARQKLSATAVAASIALLTTGEHAVAQNASELEARLKAGAASSSRSDAVRPFGNMAITPSLRYASAYFTATSSASAWLVGQQWQIGDAELTTETRTRKYHGIRGELLANASRVRIGQTDLSQQLDFVGRLHLIRENGGVYLGSGAARPLRIGTVSNAYVSTGGVWTRVGPATIRASVTNWAFSKFATNDTVQSGGKVAACPVSPASPQAENAGAGALGLASAGVTSCRRESRITDLEGGLRWEHRLMEVSMRGGQRFGSRLDVTKASRTWGSAQAAVWLSSQLAAIVGGGREPAQPTRGLPSRNFYSMGLMLAYWPIPRGAVLVESAASLVKAFELRPAGVALQRLTARIGGVESVEIMGDFTDWAAVPLVRRGRDQWELLLPMSTGVHQINMRIDGGKWIAPPGLPTLKDDFSGEVGVVVVKPENKS